ncbi:hypothetical protein F5Y16DRAFT_391772 [Xylariaceae sp. FL0255]|nr:hypothetical protein F5Y16DRAFT_391772 [Xylariaceae sp. FL0255]
MSSIESIQDGVLEIVRSSLHSTEGEVDMNADLFQLGLDSLGVMSTIKSIRTATGLTDRISPRHVYANPTISKLAQVISAMTAPQRTKDEVSIAAVAVDDVKERFDGTGNRYKKYQSFRLNAFDYTSGQSFFSMVFYIPLKEGASFQETFDVLQKGLNRTFSLIPALAGKVIDCSKDEVGYREGDRCVSVPSPSQLASLSNRLIFNDLSSTLPSFAELRAKSFPPSVVRDPLLSNVEAWHQLPADVMAAQANFVEGGCLLATEFNDCCLDGIGSFMAVRAWAENCRYLQGDETANCDWFHPESFNHSLLDIIHEEEGRARPIEEVDPGTWSYTSFHPPDNFNATAPESIRKTWTLPPRANWPYPPIYPAPRAERSPRTTLFRITKEKLAELKEHVLADPETSDFTPYISDIAQAFWWRACSRARYRVGTEIRKQRVGPDDLAIYETAVDGRALFSELLPSTYIGSLLVFNRSTMPIETLCSLSIGHAARILRETGKHLNTQVVYDLFTIYKNIPDRSRFGGAAVGIEHMNTLMSSIMMFSTEELKFGDRLFADGGVPLTMRPQLERHLGRFRLNVICLWDRMATLSL